MQCPNLFVYGTLRPGHAPAEIAAAVATLRLLGKGTIHAQFHQLGSYPGIRQLDATTEQVEGLLFALPDDPAILAQFDAYEDYRPHDPAQSLFLRVQTTVTLTNGTQHPAWVYTYNQ